MRERLKCEASSQMRRGPKAGITLEPLARSAQDAYEKSLLDEILKLQEALMQQQSLSQELNRSTEEAVSTERHNKVMAGERASRLLMLEAAASDAQAVEAQNLLKRRAEADARLAAHEEQAKLQRELDMKRKDEQRRLAVRLHLVLPLGLFSAPGRNARLHRPPALPPELTLLLL